MLGINLKKLAATLAPVAKAAAPVILTAIVLKQPIKKVLVEAAKNAARDELAKRG